jgi:hypothetical protein
MRINLYGTKDESEKGLKIIAVQYLKEKLKKISKFKEISFYFLVLKISMIQ